ncbi:DUF3005 domain-containing protein [Paraburkholderia sp. B3]|uniref:DUF3005 domain-containing protein n=1 Tax=Paraburkholderia sp. B3 TaxID=3134791 RepID=UPI00398246DD
MPHSEHNRNTPPEADADHPAGFASLDPLAIASRRILTVEVAGTAASNSSVDADGKTLEARRDVRERHDNVVTSNATMENHVSVASDGLGGFDSRTVRAVPHIAALPGYRVVVQGYVVVESRHGERTDAIISLEREVQGDPHE